MNEWRRIRKEQEVEKRRRAEGEGAWSNHRDAVSTLYKFVGGFADVKTPTTAVRSRTRPSNQRRALTEAEMLALWNAASLEDDAELFRCTSTASARPPLVSIRSSSSISRTSTGRQESRSFGRRTDASTRHVSVDLMNRIRERAVRQGWNEEIPDGYDPRSFNNTGTPAFRTRVSSGHQEVARDVLQPNRRTHSPVRPAQIHGALAATRPSRRSNVSSGRMPHNGGQATKLARELQRRIKRRRISSGLRKSV